MSLLTEQDKQIQINSKVADFKKQFADTRVLALDKDYTSLIYYKKLFPKAIIFNNPVEALAVAKIYQFDLFITELYLYPIDGIEVSEKFRKLTLNSKTPILTITSDGFCKPHVQEKFDAFLLKPANPLDIYETISKLLQIQV